MIIYVDQLERAWYRRKFIVPDDMTAEQFRELYDNYDEALEEFNTTGWYVDDGTTNMTPEENDEQSTLEFRYDQYDKPFWTNTDDKETT